MSVSSRQPRPNFLVAIFMCSPIQFHYTILLLCKLFTVSNPVNKVMNKVKNKVVNKVTNLAVNKVTNKVVNSAMNKDTDVTMKVAVLAAAKMILFSQVYCY